MEPGEKTFEHIVNEYIREKRATGYGFEKAAQVLQRIVRLQEDVDHGLPLLSAEVVTHWV